MAFKLDKKKLEELDKIIKNFSKDLNIQEKVLYNINLKNGETHEERELEELLNYRNHKDKEIVGLEVYSKYDSHGYIKVQFSEYREGVITVSFDTDKEKNMLFYKKEIEDFLETIKLGYSFFRKRFLPEIITPLVLSGLFLVFFLRKIDSMIISYNGVNNFELNDASLFLILMIFYVIIIKIIDVTFPINNFYIGFGEKKYKTLNWLRLTILGAVIGSIISLFFN